MNKEFWIVENEFGEQCFPSVGHSGLFKTPEEASEFATHLDKYYEDDEDTRHSVLHYRVETIPTAPEPEPEPSFYVLHTGQGVIGNCALFWRPEGKGYTTELNEAGCYTKRPTNRETDVLIPKEVAERLAVRHVRLDHLRAYVNLTSKEKNHG